MRPILALSMAALLALGPACSDDSSSSSGDTGSPDAVGDAVDGGDDIADAGGDGEIGDVADATPDADAADVVEEPVERTCGRPPAQDETVVYDVLSPLADFVGSASVTRDGLDVSVVIEDPSEVNPTTFDGAFEAGTRCVAAQYEAIDANLCFFNADGTPAEPESLGAQIFAFIAGGPTDRPNATLLGGVRRELDLSCSLAGFFTLDTSGLTETGDLPSEVGPAVTAGQLAYLALFEGGNGRLDTAMGATPVIEPAIAADFETGDLELEIVAGVVIDVAETATEFDVEIAFTGTIALEDDTLSGTMTVTITGDDASGTLSGAVTGERQ